MTQHPAPDFDRTVARARVVPTAAVDDDLIVIDMEAGAYVALNAVAARIWELVETPRTIGDLCDALEREFAVDADTCRREVATFLRDMVDKQLVTLA